MDLTQPSGDRAGIFLHPDIPAEGPNSTHVFLLMLFISSCAHRESFISGGPLRALDEHRFCSHASDCLDISTMCVYQQASG